MNFPERRIYYIINKVENGESLDQKKGSGRKAVKMPENMREKLEKEAIGGVDKTLRKLGRKFYISHTYASNILKGKNMQQKNDYLLQIIPKNNWNHNDICCVNSEKKI
jgi:hypothetical protein